MASNTGAEQQLDAELECAICKEYYDDPVELMCKHNFCRECIYQFSQKLAKDHPSERRCECPVCRKKIDLTPTAVKKMPTNLKLRNILSALKERNRAVPGKCQKHNKTHFVYCYECMDVKCFSCFKETCKSSHNTDDIEALAAGIQEQLNFKVEQCKDRRKKLNDTAKNKVVLDEKLNRKVADMEQIRTRLFETDEKSFAGTITKLDEMSNWNLSELVLKKDEVRDLAVPQVHTGLWTINNYMAELEKDLKKAFDKFDILIRTHKDLLDDDRSVPSSTYISMSPDRPSGDGAASASPSAASTIADVLNSLYMFEPVGFGPMGRRSSNPFDPWNSFDAMDPWHRYGLYSESESDDSMDELNPKATIQFDQDLVESITTFNNSFYVCTSKGISEINGRQWSRVIENCHVLSCVKVDDNKVLLSKSNGDVDIRRIDRLDSTVFELPGTQDGQSQDRIISMGVSSEEPIRYFLADAANFCIHVWNSQSRTYGAMIDLKRILRNQRPSFRMALYNNVIYISSHYNGEVWALSLSGAERWRNNTACEKPNGICVTSEGVFVSDLVYGIVVLNLDGRLRCRFLSHVLEQAWSVSVCADDLAVIERFYRHNTRRSPIEAKVYRLSQLFSHA